MEKLILNGIMESVFNQITARTKSFIEWYGYKTAELELVDVEEKIGIGINKDFSAIKLFYIDREHYAEGDAKRFRQTFRIGSPENVKEPYWNVELAQRQLNAPIGDVRFLSNHIEALNQIMQMIYASERHALRLG